jgi:predicted enzyme related to lactoylglutathione lyase
MSKRPIVFVEIPAKDRRAAQEFYGNVFGWGDFTNFEEFNYTTFSSGNTGGGFAEIGQVQPGDIRAYIMSEDVDADLKAIQGKGGKTALEKMEIPGGWIAWFEDPTGNTLALWQGNGEMDGPSTHTGKNFVHMEIPADDRDAAARLYSEIFGWTYQHMEEPAPYTVFETDSFGGGFNPVGDYAKPGDVRLYIDSDNIEADCEKIKSAGGTILGEKTEIPGMGHFIMWQDPTGNTLALWQSQ